jgi:DMSO/TMAO reductase YedYZ molybdopterin-dependent catalytic subunit
MIKSLLAVLEVVFLLRYKTMSGSNDEYVSHVSFYPDISAVDDGTERNALTRVDPEGFFIRHPQKPHELQDELTSELDLFQTIHMGAAVVDENAWKLVISGMVRKPFSINLSQLKSMPRANVTSFHECYGSPIKSPDTALWRIGNVKWTGVRLCELLRLAEPTRDATYVWSQGLESGSFAGVAADRYEKDLTMAKACCPEVLVAYEMHEQPLSKERGGPVRLIVPGWFGTNSTKWLCKLIVQDHRASGPFTTTFYNEIDPADPEKKSSRPVWEVEPNSMIVSPAPNTIVQGGQIEIHGRAWGAAGIARVDVSIDGGRTWQDQSVVKLRHRAEFEWQSFSAGLQLPSPGTYRLTARATDTVGVAQPLSGRRNHVHTIDVTVV